MFGNIYAKTLLMGIFRHFFCDWDFILSASDIQPFLFNDKEDPQQSNQLVVHHWMFLFVTG